MKENFIWLALPNDEAEYLYEALGRLSGLTKEEEDLTLESIIRRLERQINA